jgi:hypothetical protein
MENPFRKRNKENIINIEKEKQNNKEIKKENPFNKKDYVNETPDPDKIKEKEDEINKKIPNPFNKKDYINDTPDPDKIKEKEIEKVKENKNIRSPSRIQKNEIKINLNQNNINEIHQEENYINEGFEEKEKKYFNIFNNQNKNEKNNDKKYTNATPNLDDEPKEKYVPNPFAQNNIIIDKKINEEKKYVNATPGQENNNINHNVYISNPFKNNDEKNEIKIEEDKKEKNEIVMKKNDEKPIKKNKIGSHFKKKFDKDLSKLSTLSNSRPENYDYSND